MSNLYSVTHSLKNLIEYQPNINEVYIGDLFENLNGNQDVHYPVSVILEQNHSVNTVEDKTTFEYSVFMVDREVENKKNVLDIHSWAISALQSVFSDLEESGLGIIDGDYQISDFEERFDSICAGAFATVRVVVDNCNLGNGFYIEKHTEVLRLKKVVENLSEEILFLEARIAELEDESLIPVLEQEIARLGYELETAQGEIVQLQTENGRLMELNRGLEETVNELVVAINHLNETIHDLKDQIDNLNGQISEKQTEIEILEYEIGQKDEQIDNLNTEIREIYTRINKINERNFYELGIETPLTFTMMQDGHIGLYKIGGNITSEPNFEYSLNGGEWTSYNVGQSFNLVCGDEIQFRGNRAWYGNNSAYYRFRGEGLVSASGSVMSLINNESMKSYQFHGLFDGYKDLVTPPILPATGMKDNCYDGMFANSGIYCCPKLPSKNTTYNCYIYMFANCLNLVDGPEIDADELVGTCCGSMMEGCSNLKSFKFYATSTTRDYNMINCFKDVYPTGVLYKNPDFDFSQLTDTGLPSGWTIVDWIR